MNPRLQNVIVTAGCAVVAVWLGRQIADGAFFWPAVTGGAALAAILSRLTGLTADVVFTGLLVTGYFVGNRGFAQMMPAPGIPLFPAEAVLMMAGGWRLIASGFERRMPFVRDPLNWAVFTLLVVGTARVLFDVPRFGFLAIRDYAMVYYAVFFFLAQEMAREERARRYLLFCGVAGSLLLVLVFPLYNAFPDLFLTQFRVHGVPVIFFKGDLVYTYLALGSLLVFHVAAGRWRVPGWFMAAGMGVAVLGGDSRASQVGLVAAALLLLLGRRTRFPFWQGAVASVALIGTVGLAAIGDSSWAENKLNRVSDRMRSMVDVEGLFTYGSDESFSKGDNNRFRLIWWKNVAVETWTSNPAFGQGFGSDLAVGFLQEYYPDSSEEFTARSPHNIFLSVFGRMGAVGLAVWLVFCAILVRRTWRALRESDEPHVWAIWCSVWVLLLSGTFGVVLEGPMGAVPFWVFLGLANAALSSSVTPETVKLEAPSNARLPEEPARV
jgi:O-antigen ligase